MRYLTLVSAWVAAVVIFTFLASTGRGVTRHDPRADFSFTVKGPQPSEHPHMMSIDQVQRVFEDHLDREFPEQELKKLARHLIDLCHQHRLDPAFVLSLINAESSFRVEVVSYAGAVGLMQLMPPTAKMMARQLGIPYRGMKTLTDPFANISLGTAYIALLRDRYQGLSSYFPVAAYNIGPGRLDQLRMRKNFKPKGTMEYYLKIKRGISGWRHYGRDYDSYGPIREAATDRRQAAERRVTVATRSS